ncbi:4-oxalmesaconate hydratase [Emticicia aquatica]|jgi:4-oxalomesaconate hydratase|uniref:4-oxalmesaconate hydratase n=1 Tax=Emticicia aquatica TaxID=1681835 RepID=A0ABM9ALQ0_9BACT|nr:PIG-L deacetylase family protein [Emticicia aquatica]CAH0994666.1 4-oxalmesaconate hydratase [Emticicia aquatica]
MKKKLLVIGAHSGDFVWRSAGTIAKAIEEGAETLVIAMSYGERGESGELWKENPNRTEESVKIIRHEQAQKAADVIGTPIRFLDWGDYPMIISDQRIEQLTEIIGDFEPTVILTHSEKDPFNPDHPLAFQATQRARLLSSGAGVPSAFKNIDPPAWYSFEPHQPELSSFIPDTFIDISSVIDKKMDAMACMGAQNYLKDYYAELASRRANHARRISGKKNIKFAEAFQSQVPRVTNTIF